MFKKLRKRYHDFILTDWGEIFELFFGLLCAVGIMAFAGRGVRTGGGHHWQ